MTDGFLRSGVDEHGEPFGAESDAPIPADAVLPDEPDSELA